MARRQPEIRELGAAPTTSALPVKLAALTRRSRSWTRPEAPSLPRAANFGGQTLLTTSLSERLNSPGGY